MLQSLAQKAQQKTRLQPTQQRIPETTSSSKCWPRWWQFELYDELKRRLSYEKATIEATSDVLVSTIDGLFEAFAKLQYTAQKAEMTLVDEGSSLVTSSCCDVPPGFGARAECIMGTEAKIPFDVSLPAVIYGDKSSSFTRDVFEHHLPRPPVVHTRRVFKHTTSTG